MQKRGILFFVLALFVFSSFSIAQENSLADSDAAINTETTELEGAEESSSGLLQGAVEEYRDAELSDGGTRPGDAFYFVDEVFDNFASDESVTEEKAGEVFAALESGDKEAARQALERYEKYNNRILENADPEKRDILRRNAAAIYNKYNELSEEDKEEFRGVLEGAEEAATAVEISSKIKELCEQLASLDSNEYGRVCRIGDDENAPDWRRRLDSRLTEQQREEAMKFGEIMQSCFETAGRDCPCDQIPHAEFANTCSIAAPLATACDEGNEEACQELDNQEMPELPDYLQDVMADIERGVGDAQFELHVPPACKEAGVTNPEDCRQIMIKIHAPEECRDALKDVKNEEEARKICERIMMEKYNPECAEAGIEDPRDCGKFMFAQNAPLECIEAGLDGSSRDDPRKCEEIMHSLEGERSGEFNRNGPNREPGFNFDCRKIENSEERLKCYDNAVSGAKEHFEKQGPQGGWPQPCQEVGATTREACGEIMRERFGSEEFRREEFSDGEFNEGDFREGEFRGPPQGCEGLSPEECRKRFSQGHPPREFREEQHEDSSEPQSDSSGSSDDSGSGEGSVTGNVIFSDDNEQAQQTRSFSGFTIFSENRFLRYYYR